MGGKFLSRFPSFPTVSYFSREKSKTGQKMVTKPPESMPIYVIQMRNQGNVRQTVVPSDSDPLSPHFNY
jgi:hypothetical protein